MDECQMKTRPGLNPAPFWNSACAVRTGDPAGTAGRPTVSARNDGWIEANPGA